MYAVVQVGSSQYKVREGDLISANRLKVESGEKKELDKVLMYADGNDIRIGQPFLKDVKVSTKVVKHYLDDKKIAFKYRIRKDSSTKKGHRQQLTALKVEKISA